MMDNASARAQLHLSASHYKLATVSPTRALILRPRLRSCGGCSPKAAFPPNLGWITAIEQALAALPPAP